MQKEMTAKQVMEELTCIAFARATDYLQVEQGALRVADSSCLTKEQASAIASMEKTSTGVKVKFYDKLKALEGVMFEGLSPEEEETLRLTLKKVRDNLLAHMEKNQERNGPTAE